MKPNPALQTQGWSLTAPAALLGSKGYQHKPRPALSCSLPQGDSPDNIPRYRVRLCQLQQSLPFPGTFWACLSLHKVASTPPGQGHCRTDRGHVTGLAAQTTGWPLSTERRLTPGLSGRYTFCSASHSLMHLTSRSKAATSASGLSSNSRHPEVPQHLVCPLNVPLLPHTCALPVSLVRAPLLWASPALPHVPAMFPHCWPAFRVGPRVGLSPAPHEHRAASWHQEQLQAPRVLILLVNTQVSFRCHNVKHKVF